MFRPVNAKPDLVAQEHEILAEWRERRTFERLRAQNAGGPKLELPRRPDHGQQPDGRPPRLGPRLQGPLPAVPRDARRGPALAERVRLPGPVGRGQRRARPRLHEQARHRGLRHRRVRLALQAARPDLRRPPDRADDPARDVDGLERPRRAAPAARRARRRPVAGHDDPGTERPAHRHRRDARRAARHARARRQLLHVQQREQRPDLGLPRRVPQARLDLQGPRLDAVVPALRDRPLPDGDERGLRRPRGSRAHRPLPARRPARRGAPRLDDDAVDARRERRRRRRPDLEYVRIRQGDGRSLGRQGDAQAGGRRAVRGPRVEARVASSSAGATRARSTSCRRSARPSPRARATIRDAPYEHRVIPWTEVGEDEGTGHRPHRARARAPRTSSSARRSGCRSSGRSTRTAAYYDGLRLADRPRRREVAEAIVDDLERRGFFYHLEPYTHRYPHCWRCGTPLLFRLVDEWFISMGPVYDQPRDELTKEQVDASLRYQIMEVVDQIRWIPSFGYERELDWLLNMHDWMISKKRYWGLALPIYDCPACGTFDVIGGREELQRAGGRRLGAVRGPHAASAVRRRGHDRLPVVRRPGRADPGRRQPLAGRRDRAVLDAPLPRGPASTGESGSRPTSSPRASPASSATGSTRCSRCRRSSAASRRSRRSSATPSSSARTAGRCTRAGATRSSSTRPPSGWASTSCAGCSRRPGPRRTSFRLARGRRGAPRAARPVERLRVLRDLRPARRLDAGEADAGGGAGRRTRRPVLDRWIRSRAAATAADGRRRPPGRLRRARRDAARSRRSSTTSRRGTCACRASGSRGTTTPPIATRRSRRSTARSSSLTPDRRADPAVPDRVDVRQPRRRTLAGGARTRST